MSKSKIALKVWQCITKKSSGTINLTDDAQVALKNFIKEGQKVKVPNSIHAPKDNPYVYKFHAKSDYIEVRLDTLNASREFKMGDYFNENGYLWYPHPKPGIKKKIFNYIQKFYEKPIAKRRELFKANLASGNYNSNPIKFTPFKTTDDAITFLKQNGFAKRISGVKKGNAEDLERLNTLCESFTNIHNKTLGRSYTPRRIHFTKNTTSSDGYAANASYSPKLDCLLIPRYAKINGKLQPLQLQHSTVYHEIGHANHALYADLNTMARESEIYARGLHDATITTRFTNDSELQTLILQHMRPYSKHPAECAADWMMYMMQGKQMPKEINQAVEALGFPINIFAV